MKCIIDKCEGERAIRGLCSAHYTYVMEAIKQGLYTERQLIEAGMILPSKHRGEKKALFTDMLKKKGLVIS